MNEENDTLESQIIDEVIEGESVSPQDQQTTRLIQQLQTYSQDYVQTNERSLDRIWSRLVQSQDHPFSLQPQWKPSEEKINLLKERKAMQNTPPISGVMSSSPASIPSKKRRPLMRVVGLSLIAAVVLITVVSFTLFSGHLRSAAPLAGKGSRTITNVPAQQQIAISKGALACSFSAGPEVLLTNLPWLPQIAWSSQGEIAATNYASVKAYSAQNCAATPLSQLSIQRTFGMSWSPDGKKLLVGDVSDNSANVLNSKGDILVHLSNVMVAGSLWSADSTKITIPSQGSAHSLNLINVVDLNNGNKITTLATFPDYSNVGQISPDGKLAIIEQLNITQKTKSVSLSIWDITSGKKIRDFPSTSTDNEGAARFSPDGALLAVGVPGAIQIYTKDWRLVSSIADPSSKDVHTLAWSSNGKYLAENTNAIRIYDVNAKKLVTTFGAVDTQHKIVSLTWAPDTTGIASATIVVGDGIPPEDNTVNVWKLS